MRIVNDREAKPEGQEAGVLEVFSYSLLCAVGISTGFFAPLTTLVSHYKLTESLARLSCVCGAVMALVLLEAPANGVIIAFVTSLYVADRAVRDESLWRLIFGGTAVALVATAAIFAIGAGRAGLGLAAFWNQQVELFTSTPEFSQGLELAFGSGLSKKAAEYLRIQGPSIFTSALFVAVWLAIGISAHFGWTPSSSLLASRGLKAVKSSKVLVAMYVMVLSAATLVAPEKRSICDSAARVLSSLLLIQGTIALSRLLAAKGASRPVRGLIYGLGLTFGFYGVVGLGLIAPWFVPRGRAAKSDSA